MPLPLSADTRTVGDPSSEVPASSSATSSSTISARSSSAMSVFVMTTMPCWTSSRSKIATCSLVCAITPSSAATTINAMSKPPAPMIICLTKRSCPGTSTMLTSVPLSSWTQANPSSIVIPRFFSSASRSGSMPVSALMRVDLPWSTCPAVPATNIILVNRVLDGWGT